MPKDLISPAIALYDDYAHRHHDRRAFIRDMTKLAGSSVAAQMLLARIMPDEAQAAIIAADDPRLTTKVVAMPGTAGRKVNVYSARPARIRSRMGAVMIIHENRGLTDHIRDVTRRMALEGFAAFAPDFLTVSGGTPADPDAARTAIGKLDLGAAVADGTALISHLKKQRRTTGKVGVTGFCWGGGMVNRLAVAAGGSLAAAAPYYGPAPDVAEAAKVKAAMLMNYAALDERVNATAKPWAEALKAANVAVEAYFYEGANHAFNNDTSAERYNKAVAELAWSRTVALFKKHLA